MGSRAQIKMNYKRALMDADRLERISARIYRLADTQYEESVQNLSVAWSGESARLFLRKEELVKNDIMKVSENLKYIADDARIEAEKVYAAEMRAIEIANRRTSD